MLVPTARAEMMPSPGAVMSGFTAPSLRGPRLEKRLAAFVLPTLPTVRAASAAPGEPTVVARGPELPAAITNNAPVFALSSLTARDIRSVPSEASWVPRLMLTTRALLAAHSIPARTSESWHEPLAPQTRPTTSLASGATPLCLPSEAVPEPAIVAATWVPWPWASFAPSALSVKSTASATLPFRSG
jgi:hypothetical protein